MHSIWDVARTEGQGYPTLDRSTEVDVAIIGAGATGLATALKLTEGGQKVAVLEALTVGQGSTGNSTGNLYGTLSQGLEGIRKKWNQDVVREVVSARMQALDFVEETTQRFSIDCQFMRRSLYFCSAAPGQKEEMLEEEYLTASGAGLTASLVDEVPELPFNIHRALRIEHQAQYNPLRYVQGLAKAVDELGGRIFERSHVIEVDDKNGIVKTPQAEVRAKYIVHATHTPKGINAVQAEMLPQREYGISATLERSPCPEGVFWILDTSNSLRSYRYNGEDYLIVIGGKHKTGHGKPGIDYYEELKEFARTHFNIGRFEHTWSAQQYTPADGLPYIGRSPLASHSFIGTGYAADGLTWGVVAAALISDQILGRENRWGKLFDPKRFTPLKSAKNWYEENKTVAQHLMKNYLSSAQLQRLEDVDLGEGRIVEIDGEKLAVHRNQQGTLSVLSPECPHMKCMVSWNAADTTWDCPCHGSRFTIHGDVIEGPAYQPLARREPPG